MIALIARFKIIQTSGSIQINPILTVREKKLLILFILHIIIGLSILIRKV